MPPLMSLALRRAFFKFPKINFLIKFETLMNKNGIEKIDSNIFYINWMPQLELLCNLINF